MKIVLSLVICMLSTGVFAQETNPKYTKDGDRVEAVYYHSNGQVSQQGFFKEGKLSGLWMMYNEEGEKIAQGYYAKGKKTGKWFIWENGKLNEVDYIDNKIVNHILWDQKEAIVNR